MSGYKELLLRALVEIDCMPFGSAEGEEILEEGMALLELRDLSEEEVARVRAVAERGESR